MRSFTLRRALRRGPSPWRALLAALGLSSSALGVEAVFAAPPIVDGIEPTLIEAQEAAVRNAGGPKEADASRVSRARSAHWAPVVRGIFGVRDNEGTRDGELRGAPLRWTDRGQALTWGLTATWDLPQVIFARDETQLVHAHLHLEKARQAASKQAMRLYLDRRDRKRALANAPAHEVRQRLLQEVVRLTADLDALTGGLYRPFLTAELAELSMPEVARAAAPPAPTASTPVAPTLSTPPPVPRTAPQETR